MIRAALLALVLAGPARAEVDLSPGFLLYVKAWNPMSGMTGALGELPKPTRELTVSLRSEAGLGPARLGGYAVTGVPGSVAEAAALFQGVEVNVGWTHADAP